jgi:hypothetical protein
MARFSRRQSVCVLSAALSLSGCIQSLDVGGNGGSGGSAAQGGSGGQGSTGSAQGGSSGQGGTGSAQGGSGGQGGTGGQGGGGGQAVQGWSKNFGTDLYSVTPSAMAVDGSHNLYLAGIMAGPADFGTGVLTGDVYLMKLDLAGNLVWVRTFNADNTGVIAMDLDAAGNLFLTGRMGGSIDFDGTVLSAVGSQTLDVFAAKLDPDGNPLWARQYGDEQQQIATHLAVDPSGSVVITGTFAGTMDFGNGPITDGAVDVSFEIYVAKLDTDGTALYTRHIAAVNPVEGYGDAKMYGFGMDGAGNYVIGGIFQGAVDAGGPSPLVTQNQTAFFAKYDAQGNFVWQKAPAAADGSQASNFAMDVSPSGEVAISGLFGGTIDFGGGALFAPKLTSNKFVTRLDAAGNQVYAAIFDLDSWKSGNMSEVRDAVAYPDGSSALLINYQGQLDLGGLGGPLFTTPTGKATAIVRMGESGQLLGAQSYPTDFYPLLASGHDDGLGGLYVAGYFYFNADIGFGPMSAGSEWDTAVAHYVY